MPRVWHDRFSASKIEDPDRRSLYLDIAADKKPYFMRYIYPSLMKQYNEYIRNTNRNALREFQMIIDEMQALPYRDLTERQQEFLMWYGKCMPVGTGECVMNRICKRIEAEFDGIVARMAADSHFDYTILKSDKKYTAAQYKAITELYGDYNKQLRNIIVLAKREREDSWDKAIEIEELRDYFMRKCLEVCSNGNTLCNIILDICYKKSSSKMFAWEMCVDEIVENLLEKNGNMISYPLPDPDGDKVYCGTKYRVVSSVYNGGGLEDGHYFERARVGAEDDPIAESWEEAI